jgi:hypothetical protein
VYPADPPTVEEIVAVTRIAGDGGHGRRLRGLIVALWRAGLRIDEALALREADLDRRRWSLSATMERQCAHVSRSVSKNLSRLTRTTATSVSDQRIAG